MSVKVQMNVSLVLEFHQAWSDGETLGNCRAQAERYARDKVAGLLAKHQPVGATLAVQDVAVRAIVLREAPDDPR